MNTVASTRPRRSAAPGPRRDDGKGATAAVWVPLWRLYLLRAGYLMVAIGLGVTKWPLLIHHAEPWTLMEGVVNCMLAAMGLLAFLGVRYPLQMLPVLLFEAAWKLIWLAVVALPLWTTQQMDAATREMTSEILWVVIVLAVIPWRHVFTQYVTKHGDRWRPGRTDPAGDNSAGV